MSGESREMDEDAGGEYAASVNGCLMVSTVLIGQNLVSVLSDSKA